jgi:uncharacterized Rmd1/YagE family protein
VGKILIIFHKCPFQLQYVWILYYITFYHRYLELSARTEVLNTRVDMLRELLAVLQQRQDNSSAVKLEWIVIWLIVVSAAIESCAILVTLLKKEY